MIRNRNFIHIDCHGKELQEQGLQLFDLIANYGDIHQFIASCIPSHWHHELEIFLLLEGTVQIGVGDNIYRIEAGEGCFINSDVIHSFTGIVQSPCTYHSFVFDSGIVSGTPGSIFDTMYVRPLLTKGPSFLKFQQGKDDDQYFTQFNRAFNACIEELPGYEFQVRDALSSILLHIKQKSQIISSRSMPTIQETRIKQMLAWIDEHIKQNVTVRDIADTVNICPRECQRIFSRYLHYSPMEYIRRRRIFTAAQLLSTTDIPVTDIALDCGFASSSYFSKQFKALVGSTPVEYRMAIQQKGNTNLP
ncbi:MAG: helix-turn-helix domain-containing protein [Coprococcus sp.]